MSDKESETRNTNDRREEERRKKQLPVEIDRREVEDRRNDEE